MRSFFQKKKHNNKTSIVFILESGSISSAIIKNENNLAPNFLWSSNNSLFFQQEVNPDIMTEMMLGGLKTSAEKMAKEGLPKFSNQIIMENMSVDIFFASPWYVSAINTSVIAKDKPFLIKESEIKEAAEKTFTSDPGALVIEHNILSVKANGYDILNPVGKHAETLEIKSFANSVSEKIVKKVEEIVHSSFPNSKINFYTIAQALFPVTRELMQKKDFMLFVPEYETSEIILIRENSIEGSVSIPFGRHTPLRAISSGLQKEKENAESLLHLFLSNELEESMKNQIGEIIKTAEESFQESLRDAFWKLSGTNFLPKDIIVSDEDDISKLLGEWIKNDSWISGAQGGVTLKFLEKNIAENKIKKENTVGDLDAPIISAGFYLKSI